MKPTNAWKPADPFSQASPDAIHGPCGHPKRDHLWFLGQLPTCPTVPWVAQRVAQINQRRSSR